MKRYFNKEEETNNTIIDGWTLPGDLGYKDEGGSLYIGDRKKDMIIKGGYNVYPREIEELLYTHPDTIECAVIGKLDAVFGEKVIVYVVSHTNYNEDEYIYFCKRNLVHYKVPEQIYFYRGITENKVKESF
ncbi:AMP-binding enzyme [Alkalihalobacterium alkalinitrilicum]|uniref:AMP-binding enzyme n=1 Tax=Alkalihalobacterium alkalinitrilicum TaxID=427920 RepID=UPI00099499FF|nr:AMP-binding protein [Alkalihalobacterium alkalinitrilicum]